jgi:hypothetical protein
MRKPKQRKPKDLPHRHDIMEAKVDANFDQLNRMADTKNLQDIIHL